MKRSNLITLVLLLLATVGLLTLKPDSVQAVKGAFLEAISPFLKTGSLVQNQMTTVTTGLKTLDQLEKENFKLRVENKNLKAINLTLRNLEEDNNRLRRSLAYRERAVFKLVPARIISRKSETWWNSIWINCGKDKGLKTDMPVVTDEGLIGKTTTVSDSISEVVLVTDERLQVAADVEGSREQGIVQGSRLANGPTPLLVLNFLTKDAELTAGQKVYCSGMGGVFPSGVLIGTVKGTEKRAIDTQAMLMPAVDMSNIEDLFVIIGG